MKKIFIIALTLMFAFSLEAQIVKVIVPIYEGKQLARSAGDSSSAIVTLGYTGTLSTIAPGQIPDSVFLQAFTPAGDTAGTVVRFKASIQGSGLYTTTYVDSVSSVAATILGYQAVTKVPASLYTGFDKVTLSLVTGASGATSAASAINAAKITARLVFFYNTKAYRP